MTQTPTADQLRADALRGTWRAVLADELGFVITLDDLDDADFVKVCIVRDTAMPQPDAYYDGEDDGPTERLPGWSSSADTAFRQDDFLDDDEVRLVWERAQAMAAGLNAASSNTDTTPARIWSLPDEPGPNVTRLRDRNGDTWYRDPVADDPWTEFEDGEDSTHVSWEQLVTELGPLTDITPADADATPDQPQQGDGANPSYYCEACDVHLLPESVSITGTHTFCGSPVHTS